MSVDPSAVTVLPEQTGGTRSYRGPAHTGAPRLTGLADVAEVRPVTEAEVRESERVDTDDLRLFATGVELTVERVTPDRAAVTPPTAAWVLRLPDGEPAEELRVPIPADEHDTGIPAELDELIARVRGDGELRPVGRIRIVRAVDDVHADDGRVLAVLQRDEVQVTTLGESTTIEGWTESVLRPATASVALLDGIEAALRETGLDRAAGQSRERLAALLEEAEPVQPPRERGRKGSAGRLVLDYIGEQFDTLSGWDPEVRAERPDSVHRMRIAARRIRSALRTYKGVFEGPRTPHLVAELRWLGRALAGERDAEVQEERLTEQLAELEDELVLGPVQAAATRYFARLRADTGARVLETLDDERYVRLLGGLRRLLVDPPLSARAGKPADDVLPAMVARTATKLERRIERALTELEAGEQAPTSLHDARKTGKQLRYATEVARPAVGKDATRFARGLKSVQRLLGAHQDLVVSRQTLRLLGAAAGVEGRNGFTYGVLHGRDTATMLDLEQRLPEVWRTNWTKKSRKWMTD